MPALDEAENLKWLLPQLPKNYCIVVVDNGSTDDTYLVAQALATHAVGCQMKGYGSAVMEGVRFLEHEYQIAGTDVLVIMDADGTSSPSELEKLLSEHTNQEADLTLGQRESRLQEKGAMPSHASFGNWLQVSLLKIFTGVEYADMGPLRCLRWKAYRALKMEDPTWAWNVEMQMKAAHQGLRITEVPISYQRRRHGKSKISGSFLGSIKAGSKILLGMLIYYRKSKQLIL